MIKIATLGMFALWFLTTLLHQFGTFDREAFPLVLLFLPDSTLEALLRPTYE